MKTIEFNKMHALGNDFVIVNNLQQKIDVKKIPIAQLANRHTGIGFDQLIIIENSDTADFSCRFFNADGSEAEQCGNGVRCVARFLHEENFCKKKSLTLQTKSRAVNIDIENYDAITVNMGIPELSGHTALEINNKSISLHILSMGNPHAILQVSSIQDTAIASLAPIIAQHAIFPAGVNVGFMEIVNKQHIRLRTHERGVGETLACGSNACAAVVAGITDQGLDDHVKVELTLGNLWITWKGNNEPVFMTGPASRVYAGYFSVSS